MIDLVDVERPLALFAEGIAGHYCHLRVGDEDAADRNSVYVPASIDIFEDDAGNEATYRLKVLVQLGFQEFGTFEFDVDRARELIAALGARKKPDFHRESDLTIFFNHFDVPMVARQLFHVLELARVEEQVLIKYPGARKYLDALAPYTAPPPAPLRPAIARVRVPTATVYTTVEAVTECYEMLAPEPGQTPGNEFPGQIEWLQREARLEDWSQELESTQVQLAAVELAEELGTDEKIVGDGEGDGDIREVGQDLLAQRDQLQRRIDMERAALRHRLGDAHGATKSFLYDEWDYLTARYKRGWCTLFEELLVANDKDASPKLTESVRPYARAVRKHFEQIRPSGYQRIGKVVDGDELDLNMIIDARSDMRVGVSPDERVYSRRERIRRDVGAAFLVDLSASTDDPIVDDPPPRRSATDTDDVAPRNLRDPYPDHDDDPYSFLDKSRADELPRRRIIDIQKEAVTLMTMALEGIGDQYGVYGFSGYGRDCVEFYVAKEFNEPFNRRTLDAIAAMKPKRSTRMGPAIRHAAMKLQGSGAALKVLMIVSDGFPQDCDYGPERGDHEYGVQDTAKALEEAERAGIVTFCVTVDRSGNDYLRRMCPDARYMVIEETEELPEALQKAYRRLTQI